MHTVTLIVEDNAAMRATIRSMLNGVESEFCECSDGEDALEMYRLHRPWCVLMDVRMRNLDGITATKQILASFPDALHEIHILQNGYLAKTTDLMEIIPAEENPLVAVRYPGKASTKIRQPLNNTKEIMSTLDPEGKGPADHGALFHHRHDPGQGPGRQKRIGMEKKDHFTGGRLGCGIHLATPAFFRMQPDYGPVVDNRKGALLGMAIHHDDFATDPSR